MRTIAEPTAIASSVPRTLVVIPFGSRAEAELFASHIVSPTAPLITDGREQSWPDPDTGDDRVELCFAGGWRAKFAGGGEVVIARGGRRT